MVSLLGTCIMMRRRTLQEMYLEARGSYEQAEALIQEELQRAPESQMLLKRQVALEKTKGNLAGAIETLRKYVDIFQTDKEAWEELGQLYLEVSPAKHTLQGSHGELRALNGPRCHCCVNPGAKQQCTHMGLSIPIRLPVCLHT